MSKVLEGQGITSDDCGGVPLGKKVEKKASKPWKGFVNCEMNSQRREQFTTWDHAIADLSVAIQECLSPGYKISFAVDTYHDAVQVSWTCNAEGDKNEGWCLTARAASIEKAFTVLLFKHIVILEGDWSESPILDQGGDFIG